MSRVVAVAASLVVLLGACGGDGGEPDAATPTIEAASPGGTAAPGSDGPAPAAAPPTDGGDTTVEVEGAVYGFDQITCQVAAGDDGTTVIVYGTGPFVDDVPTRIEVNAFLDGQGTLLNQTVSVSGPFGRLGSLLRPGADGGVVDGSTDLPAELFFDAATFDDGFAYDGPINRVNDDGTVDALPIRIDLRC